MRRLFCVLALVVVTGVLTTTGCSHKKAVVAPEPAESSASSQPSTTSGQSTMLVQPEPAVAPAGRPESGINESELPTDLEQLNKAGYIKDCFFDTNKADLLDETRTNLATNALWLKSHPTVKVIIEGHCDERNTEEYNLALGWRRANATKDYLVSLGVGGERIGTISYGEEKPFAIGHDETAFRQNRRAHFSITAR